MSIRLVAGLLLASALALGCGNKEDKPKKSVDCGNGAVDPGELCDPAIAFGEEGACPTQCEASGDVCAPTTLQGSRDSCDAECVTRPAQCGSTDGCCPSNCGESEDEDCAIAARCGDGVFDPGEACDPGIPNGDAGACICLPNPAQACATVVQYGDSQACELVCVAEAITACTSGDGCCAPGCTTANDGDCEPFCGDGILDDGEVCDGNCPSSCDDTEACTVDTLLGDASRCDAQCQYDIISSCNGGDGCCPEGCDFSVDSDCAPTCDMITSCGDFDDCCPSGCDQFTDPDCSPPCGNGTLDAGETCDGDCPATCDDGVACTADSMQGSAATCDVVCINAPITACRGVADGCCPAGCTSVNDSDCSATCGNGVREALETCDGNCPTSCNDQNACTTDVLSGTPSQCNVSCSFTTVSACTPGDGCCPAGCTYPTDSDCACVPDTCAGLGWTCGTLADDGCGGTEQCGTCGAGEVCSAHSCEPTYLVGNSCTSAAQCAADGLCITQAEFAWPNGYCTRQCVSDTDCGALGHCDPDGLCQKSCTSNADCRGPAYECFDADSDGDSECAPVGSGAGAPGAACTSFSDCAGGQGGFCSPQASTDTKDGYCSELCASDTDCPGGSHCGAGGTCLDSCATAGECRGLGYDCYDSDGDTRLECYRFAGGAGVVGAACSNYWECGGGAHGACAIDGWVGGYCTVLCAAGEGTCPTGATCDASRSDICVDDCQNNNQCRVGYSCKASGAGTNACLP